MYKIKGLIIGILTFVSMAMYAQSVVVTGKVLDGEGYEVIGGSVTLKGAPGVGTITDAEGKFSLKVNNAAKDILVFSYVGMTTKRSKSQRTKHYKCNSASRRACTRRSSNHWLRYR